MHLGLCVECHLLAFYGPQCDERAGREDDHHSELRMDPQRYRRQHRTYYLLAIFMRCTYSEAVDCDDITR
jgi:hypothetical protein